MVSYCPPPSDSSYSRGGKSTGKHRQGSSPLPPPCTISLFFIWPISTLISTDTATEKGEVVAPGGEGRPPLRLHPAGDAAVEQLLC